LVPQMTASDRQSLLRQFAWYVGRGRDAKNARRGRARRAMVKRRVPQRSDDRDDDARHAARSCNRASFVE